MEPSPAAVVIGTLALIAIGLMLYNIRLKRQRHAQRVRLAVLEMERDKDRADVRSLAERLRHDTQRAELLMQRSREMLFIHGITGKGLPGPFLEVNAVAAATLGYSPERLCRLSLLDIEHAESHMPMTAYARLRDSDNTLEEIASLTEKDTLESEQAISARRQMRHLLSDGAARYEETFVTRTGQQIPVDIHAVRFEEDGETRILISAVDITRERQAALALRESERRSSEFLAHAALGVAMYDGERALVNVNRIGLRLFGAPDRHEFARFNMFQNPYIPERTRGALNRGESVRYEATIDFDELVQTGAMVSSRTGTGHFVILINNLGVDQDYQAKGYFVQVEDITDRRRAEADLEISERQLRQAQKLQAIGTLAGGIAHDFNNILTPILGYSEMAIDQCDGLPVVREYLGEVVKASMRGKDLANQILTFSRQSEPERRPVRITPIIKEVLNLQRAALPGTIEIRRAIRTQRDIVIADPSQIHQVMMNLCTNAAHAMRPGGGLLEVNVSDLRIQAGASSDYPDLKPGRYVCVSVRDTGCGIDAKVADRVFEPFFTTKERGEGSGMGLAVVHGIVSTLGGAITLTSESGAGTVFHVVLPTVDIATEAVLGEELEIPFGDNECILFVDDEPDIVKMQSLMLASLGYEPVGVLSSTEALARFAAEPERFDLVLTDQVMPDMSGIDLARHIHELRAACPIVICTGFSDTIPIERAKSFGVRDILMKPIEKIKLAQAIRQALDEPAAGGSGAQIASAGLRSDAQAGMNPGGAED